MGRSSLHLAEEDAEELEDAAGDGAEAGVGGVGVLRLRRLLLRGWVGWRGAGDARRGSGRRAGRLRALGGAGRRAEGWVRTTRRDSIWLWGMLPAAICGGRHGGCEIGEATEDAEQAAHGLRAIDELGRR